jgi:transcriptional regulator with AAA-type ATPase domain
LTGETSGPDGGKHYRLRGDVGGVERSYLLAPGEARVGSIPGNEILLPVRGVSRRHALVKLGNEGVVLEDLESKNGVLVNGTRVQRAVLKPQDEVRFGPVRLRLEELEADDTELAIAMPTHDALPLVKREDDSTTATAEEVSHRGPPWLGLIEGFLVELGAGPRGDLSRALGFLARELPAQGACVVEWTDDPEVVVVAGAGEIGNPSSLPAFQDLLRSSPEDGETAIRTGILEGDPPLSCALLGSGSPGLGLLLWGDFRGRRECQGLLRNLIRLLDRFRPRPIDLRGGRGPRQLRGLVLPEGYVAGESAAMASLYEQMQPLLEGDLPVLILGETGVGKEYLAHILHASSARHGGPFVAINCAAIPADLLEAEMFGIGKGVATGVVERRGKFQMAEGGTLFLDEIGDMSLDLQAKLLRALEEKEIHPVGSAPVSVDIRVVAATNTDLLQRIEDGRFRRDLYYRIAGYVLRLPPLRERKDDIPLLIEDFIRTFSAKIQKSVRGVTVKALRTLVDYPWLGNVRELEHEVRRLVYVCPDDQPIDSMMLSEHLRAPGSVENPGERGGSLGLEGRVQELEGRLIREALSRAGGNRTQAAKLLGISRNGLAIKMERLGIAH